MRPMASNTVRNLDDDIKARLAYAPLSMTVRWGRGAHHPRDTVTGRRAGPRNVASEFMRPEPAAAVGTGYDRSLVGRLMISHVSPLVRPCTEVCTPG